MSPGLELGGDTSPLKYLTSPVTDLIRGSPDLTTLQAEARIEALLEQLETNFTSDFVDFKDDINSTKVQKLSEALIRKSADEVTRVIDEVAEEISMVLNENNLKTRQLWLNTRGIDQKLTVLSQSVQGKIEATVLESLSLFPPYWVEPSKNEAGGWHLTRPLWQSLTQSEPELEAYLRVFLNDIRNIHPKWSTLTFVIMFAPGLLVGIYALLTRGLKTVQNCPLDECPHWFQSSLLILCFLMTFCFPIGALCVQAFELVIVNLAYRGYIKDYKMLIALKHITEMTTVLEAFFESGPQIVLQIYITCATREVTATQAVSIMISLIMLAKTTVVYDMMYNETGTGNRTFGQTSKYLLAILPLYATSAVFKAGSIALFCIFFGFYTSVLILLLFLVLLLITHRMGFNFSDGLILSLTNLIVVSNDNAGDIKT